MVSIDSSLALELRIRLLEAILNGTSDQPFASSASSSSQLQQTTIPASHTLSARSSRIQSILNATIKESSSLASFIKAYDKNAPFLNPGFVLGQPGFTPADISDAIAEVQDGAKAGSKATVGDENDSGFRIDDDAKIPLSALALPPQAQAALLLEAESELQALERTLSECKVLDERGVAGAGQLGSSETLTPTLRGRWEQHEKRKLEVDALERDLSALLDAYTGYTDAASQIFIAWDDHLTDMEVRVSRAEKARLQEA